MEILPLKSFDKTIECKSDKSVTHRAVMFNAAFGDGTAVIKNPLLAADCLSTVSCMRRLGAEITVKEDRIIIERCGISRSASLDVGNSGTTIRLLSGLLSGIPDVRSTLAGDDSIARRPMKRVIDPLTQMGGKINSSDDFAPLEIEGARLHGIDYVMPVKSAQVKSAVLLAGVNADGETIVREQDVSRDHTERMLKAMGADISFEGGTAKIVGGGKLHSLDVNVCGDISSAAYAMALAAGLKGGRVTVKNVGINPTRTGIIDVLKAMGANVEFENINRGVEDIADITVRFSSLKPAIVGGTLIPRLIDELPVIAVLMALAEGDSVIKDAEELKVKESDRIETTVNALRNLGVDAESRPDGLIVHGKGHIAGGGTVDSCGDHRIAMAMSVAMALSEKGGTLTGETAVGISYPDFFSLLN